MESAGIILWMRVPMDLWIQALHKIKHWEGAMATDVGNKSCKGDQRAGRELRRLDL